MEILVVWLLFAALIGAAASSKGRSGLGWFFIAILISPIIAGIIVLIIPRVRREPERPVIGVADELTKLAGLRDTGMISPAEFDQQRTRLLWPTPPPTPPGLQGWQDPKARK